MAVDANVNSSIIVLVYVLYNVISNALCRINTKCVPSKCIYCARARRVGRKCVLNNSINTNQKY